MKSKAQVITHEAFGHLEVIMEGGKAFFPATEVAQVLWCMHSQRKQ